MPVNAPIIASEAVPPFMKNGYVLACPVSREAAFIDPGDEAPKLLEWVERQELRLVVIVNTHGHLDHISGVGAVKARWDVPVCLHPGDLKLYQNLSQQAAWFGLSYPPAPPVDRLLHDGEIIQVGELTLKVHHTPGHSPGSVCLEVGEDVFCGDLIFAGSVGRTDLPGGSYETLMASIRERIMPLGDNWVLHCGHGPVTTVGAERQNNPFLRRESS
jgi:hydroxyacylglutathione hydrolase